MSTVCAEHSYLDRRIARAYERYMRAKGEWADAWAKAFVSNTKARNAIAAVEKVRFPARDRVSGAGTRSLAFGCVSDLEGKSTTGFVDSPFSEGHT